MGYKPEMTIDFDGPEGNIFFIVGKASRLISNGKEMCDKVRTCESYEKALDTIEEYVTITTRIR